MNEAELSEKQRQWLQRSREIGAGPMTKSERKALEKLYAEMSPEEQTTLQDYIHEKFGKKEDDPIQRMSEKVWSQPSEKLRQAFGKIGLAPPPGFRDKS